MTSVERVLRQRDQATSFLQAPTNACYYILVAGIGNRVGNYGTTYGYMAKAGVNPALIPEGTLLRDMGKTIFARTSFDSFVDRDSTAGYFRQVQFIDPQAAVAATGRTTFGVGYRSCGAARMPTAGNIGDKGYGTYYIPIVIGGTIGTYNGISTVTEPSPDILFGEQM